MQDKFKQVVLDDLKKMAAAFILLFVVFLIVFYKENILVTFKTLTSLFWLFVLPGFSLMYHWQKKINFLERFITGTVLGFAVINISSYYLGIFGLHVKFHGFILPVLFLIIATIIKFIELRKK